LGCGPPGFPVFALTPRIIFPIIRKEKWEGRLSNYQEVDGIMVPGEIEATWLLEEGKHTYARFQVKDFEFNTPKPW
jgi:hypothetical protein